MSQQYVINNLPLDIEGLRRGVHEYRKHTGQSSTCAVIVMCSDKNMLYLTNPPDYEEVPDSTFKLKGFAKVIKVRFVSVPDEVIGKNWFLTGNKWDQAGKVVVIGRCV
jgi:hypothetical protein